MEQEVGEVRGKLAEVRGPVQGMRQTECHEVGEVDVSRARFGESGRRR